MEGQPPEAPGVREDVRATGVFQESVPVSAVPADRLRRGGRGEAEQAGARQPAAAGGRKQEGHPAAKTAVRRERVREPAAAAAANDAWDALSFRREDPVAPPLQATSALAREIGGRAKPQRLPHLGPRVSGTKGGGHRDNLNLQVSVDVSDASGAFRRMQLVVFAKCTVDQVISMALRDCKKLDTGTDWGSDRDYELYVVDSSSPAGEINPDLNPLQGSQKIGDYPGQLNFALVRISGDEADDSPRPGGGLEEDAAGAAGAPLVADRESFQRPPPVVAQQLKSAAEELLENVGTQNVCKHCGERIDFIQVSPDKIGSLKKQMDHTGLWKDRWFQLYGNHLVYWNAAKEDLDLASGRGVIHLDRSVGISSSQTPIAPPAVDTAASVAGSGNLSNVGASSHGSTIMAGSVTSSVEAGEETHAGRKLLTQVSDPLDDSIEGISQRQVGGAAGPADSGAMSVGSPKATEFTVVLPHKTYKFRASSSQERDSWVAALKSSAQTLFHTCLFCWKNVDPSSSSQPVVCSGYLYIQLNPKLPKQFDKRWMVLTTNEREGSTHIVYYNQQSDEGARPALGCIHLYEGENRISVYASEFESRTDASGGEYTVYKLNVRRGDERHVLFKRWSKCDKFHKDLAREQKLPASVYFPRKWQQTNDASRLEKRRCQLNHYFAELSGWANREGLDLWDPSVSETFPAFVFESIDDEDGMSASRGSGLSLAPVDVQGAAGSAHRDGSNGSDADGDDPWEDSYLTIRGEKTRETLVPQPPARLGSFAFGVSQSKPSDSSSSSGGGSGGGAASPIGGSIETGSPREGLGSPKLEALRESDTEIGDRFSLSHASSGGSGGADSGGDGGSGGKHYLHLQSPLKTYYLYAETEVELNRWLDALALPWLGTSSPPTGSYDGGAAAAVDSTGQIGDGPEGQPAALTNGTSGGLRKGSATRPGMLDTRVSLSSRSLDL